MDVRTAPRNFWRSGDSEGKQSGGQNTEDVQLVRPSVDPILSRRRHGGGGAALMEGSAEWMRTWSRFSKS
ncbi:hypothetical protein EYF80_023533 [Liparis tanakae]|uniref:Uncharacterized protein n=1 Tax=Liparis tanakae TaxID=230148 RepID=A0A4Z2HK90_9TELE|nr:hypothetical protein EYF80_023533 [Liparis tanakae]